MSSQICSHCLAVAQINLELQLFLEWYSKSNITAVGMHGSPSGSGRKGGKPRRQRNRKKTSETVYDLSKASCQVVARNCSIVGSTNNLIPNTSSNDTLHFNFISLPTRKESVPSSAVPTPSSTPLGSLQGVPYAQHPLHFTYTGYKQPTNTFYFKFITGNIRICQGCRLSLRASDGSIPPPPYNLAVARAECQDKGGNMITPTRESVYHYHCVPQCIHSVEPAYNLSAIIIPVDLNQKLSEVHKQHITSHFGINHHMLITYLKTFSLYY